MSTDELHFYRQTPPEQMTLRDHLARDRTVLANERTLLSYLRTAFGFAVAGGTILKFFAEDPLLVALALALMAGGLLTTLLGIWRFFVIRGRLRQILQTPPQKTV